MVTESVHVDVDDPIAETESVHVDVDDPIAETESVHVDVDDPIAESFPLMVDAATRLCRKRDPNGVCFKYHRMWPYLRRLGRGGVWRYPGHFLDSFRELARDGRSQRVLVSGCADYSLLAYILHAYRAEGVEPVVAISDICEAPLFINRWYAERHNASIRTLACDILDYPEDATLDVITTDNFISRILPNTRSLLLSKWRDLLRPGGKFVATQQHIAQDPTFRDERVKAVRARTLELAQANPSVIDIAPEAVADYVAEYHAARPSHPLPSLDELRQLFEDNGFRLEVMSRVSLRDGVEPHESLSGTKSKRMGLVATRI